MRTAEGELSAGSLVPSIHVDTLLAHRQQAIAITSAALAELVRADRLAVEAGFGSVWRELAELMESTRYARYSAGRAGDASADDDARANPAQEILAGYEKALDAGAWHCLMRESGLRTFMDSLAREEWDTAIQEKKTPPLTIGNIEATFRTLYDSRTSMVERGVINLFKRLSWHYKTNLPHRLGKRLIVSNVRGFYSTACDKLDDLVRAMCLFDGVPEPDHRHGMSVLIGNAEREGLRECANAYISVRWFKNGNGHLTFKREDLVDKLNFVIAKHYPGALPPGRSG